MSSRHHIDDFMRGRIIGKIQEGRKITDVAREFDIAHSVVSWLWKSFKTTGMCSRRHGGGRVRSATPAEDRYIVLSAKRNRRTTAQQVANQFLAASGKQISRKTVARRLRGGGLYARRPVVCVPLTRQHRTARFQWCHEHHNWTEQDWACLLFSDESRFSLSSDYRRQLIWRESGTAYRPENIQEKDRYPTCSTLGWAGIMINGRTRLHVVANGTMTGQRYIDEVLLPHVRLFRGAVGDKFVSMDDNATCHRTLAVQDCLDSEGIQRLVWPARSPDLNPIENVWDALERQVAGRNYPPTNKNTLIRALTEEWDKLPQQLLDKFVQSDNVTVNGDRYRAIITNFFIPELNNHDVLELWFQQDGATCHTARATIDLLKDTLVDRLISRFGPVNWPPRSCDLTPLDYLLWGYVKSLVYADKPQTLDHLEDNIRRVIADIRPQMLEKVIENWTSGLDYIRASRGSPMPEIIFKM
ncbi:transposable element Tc1 transposase [Trichonephila clavipes]|nr:transposable element Tc1 transposase [Trichonephila clavipes]